MLSTLPGQGGGGGGGGERGWAWCSLWVMMLMRMQDALEKRTPGSGPCILEGLTFPVMTVMKGQGILVPRGCVYTSPMTPFLCHTLGTWEPAILCSNGPKPAYSLCITSTPVHFLKSGLCHWQVCTDLGLVGWMCVCVCVCMCVRSLEGESKPNMGRGGGSLVGRSHLSP